MLIRCSYRGGGGCSTLWFTFSRRQRSIGAIADVTCESQLATDVHSVGGSVEVTVAVMQLLEAVPVN